ncbi:FxSxx-COOH system tetratricopeptide repeat protein [Streptomyces canus]|uniref:FxSxx-COOH system tetratricopeptide repeat protein n=1 Tax=Streptomyces canus TaxID=58343 RepID=UPI00131D00AD|nr:FxSxx-COOH system tetratricopeptide repeat protein [Streptomyces canus]
MTWPHQVGTLPREAGCFQDRATARQLEQPGGGGIHVLVGLGGAGKTQLAAHHARALWQTGRLDLLVWATAATRDAIIASYAQAAVEVLGADTVDSETAVRALLAWLEPKPGMTRRWLVVLDDLADPADIRDLWPPRSPHGRTLITTRRRDATLTGHGCRMVPVGLFTAEEATSYLTTALAAHSRDEPIDQLVALANTLGHLPLALSQAVAYLVDSGLTCANYRDLLMERSCQLTDVLPDPSGLPDDQTSTVAAAWSLSLERADRLPPVGLARPMLELCAMLDPNGIPASVLFSQPSLAHLAQPGALGQTHVTEVSARDANQVLRALHRLSLIDHSLGSTHQAVRIHQLVQRALRDFLPAGQRDRLARTAADALIAAWPEDEPCDTPLAQALRANTEALALHARDALFATDAHPVLPRAGRSLGKAGQVGAAHLYFKHLVGSTQHHLGADHPDTFVVRNDFATWRYKAGDVTGAIAELEQLIADMERVLGANHPRTLIVRQNVAIMRRTAGDVVGTIADLERLIADMERVLGANHPRPLTARHILAVCRSEVNDTVRAFAHLKQLIADQERVLGTDHPDTLSTRHNLAIARGRAGDVAEAIAELEKVVADRERVLGTDHPDTLTARFSLLRWRMETEGVAAAITAVEKVVADHERVLGTDHPNTLKARHRLATWRWKAGDVAGAIAELEKVVADQERMLATDHPDTLSTRHRLAVVRGRAGDVAGAIAELEKVVADRERVLGANHPDTLIARRSLLEQVVTDQERMLGADHPNTVGTLHDLAQWQTKTSAAREVPIYEQLAVDREREWGPDHPDSLYYRYRLAIQRWSAGDAAGAIADLEQLLPDQNRVLGPEDSETLRTRNELARWRTEAQGPAIHRNG